MANGSTNGITASKTDARRDAEKIQPIMPKPEPKTELLAALDACKLSFWLRIWDSDSWQVNQLDKAIQIVAKNADSLANEKEALKTAVDKAFGLLNAWYGVGYKAQKLVEKIAALDPELAQYAFEKATEKLGGESWHKQAYGELAAILVRKNTSLATQKNIEDMEERLGRISFFAEWNKKTKYYYFEIVGNMVYANNQLTTKELLNKIVDAGLTDEDKSSRTYPWRVSARLLAGYIRLHVGFREEDSRPGESIADMCRDADGGRKVFPATTKMTVSVRPVPQGKRNGPATLKN